MKSFPFLCLAVVGSVLSGCSEANASGFNPANPLHCVAQFQSYEILARQQGETGAAEGFGIRSQWYAESVRSLLAEELTHEALEVLSNKIAAQRDGGLALATECIKRQDADPDFQRMVKTAKKALADGVDPSTPMHDVFQR